MRRQTKKQLLDLVNSILEAGTVLCSMPAGSAQMADMLTDIQAAAISVGEKIEEAEGEGTQAVFLLEKYCEELYLLSNETAELSKINRIGRLKVFLEQTIEAMDKFNETYDVVFLPYKASMWDCMESVWLAAKEDPNCTPYVIPIPYYDKNEDRTLGTMHYEVDMMPDYVPVTHYDDYNLEVNQPEVIYIHNPFDAGNRVTTVHPYFYSSELKKYTQMLVYIPYFMTNGALPESHDFLPVYAHADKIVLQNEDMI